MAILTVYDEQFPCSVAMKGDDYIRLLDEEGNIVFFADGITDFSPYILDGSWEYPYKRSATIVSCTAALVEGVLTLTPKVPTKIESFATLVFQAPCDCNMFASLSICDKTYDVVDAMGTSIIGGGSTWCKNAYVSLMIDHVNRKAYVLNESSRDYAKRVSGAYNLLDNSDFTHFVALAGIGGNHGTQAYAGCRWILDSGTVTGEANAKNDGYKNITLNGTIRQIVANPPTIGTVAIEMVSGTASVIYKDDAVTITSNGGVIKNVRLFDGEFTAETIPPYVPKGFGAESMECLRYYRQSFSTTPKAQSGCVIVGGATANTTETVNWEIPMRIAPTITLYNPLTGNANEIADWVTDTAITGASVLGYSSKGFYAYKKSGITKGNAHFFHYTACADF